MKYYLTDLFEFIRNGKTIKQGVEGGYPITRIETISHRKIDKSKMGYAGIYDLDKFEDYLLLEGDILMSHINSETHLGKTALYEKVIEGEKIIHGMNLLCLRPKKDLIHPKYANYYFNSLDFKKKIYKIMKKSVNQVSFSVSDLKKIQLNIPNKSVQSEVVNILDNVQSLLYKRNTQIAALSSLTQSVFFQMFGDPVNNPLKWEMRKLGDLGNWNSGGTPSRGQKEYFQGDIPWLSSGELNQLYTYNSKEYISEKAIEETSAKIIPINSLLLGMYDTAGLKSTITKVKCSCNQAIAFSRLENENVSTEYVYYVIQLLKEFLKSQQRGVRQKNFNLTMIKNIEIPLPPFNLQKKFEHILLNVEDQKTLLEKSILQMEDYFMLLLQREFTEGLLKTYN